MRSSLVGASLLGLMLATGCTVGDTSTPGGGGDDNGATDGDDVGGDDDGVITPDAAPLPDPTLTATSDKTAINTELLSENMVTLTFQGGEGFAGPVNVAATAVDDTGAPIPGWTVNLSAPSVTLTANGSGSVVATLAIPSTSTALAGKIHFAVTSSLEPQSLDSTVTVLKQVTIPMNVSGGDCAYPADDAHKDITIKKGTKVRWLNNSTTSNITIHAQNGAIPHQPDPGSAPGAAYEVTTNGTGTTIWYCHAPGPTVNNLSVTVTN